MPSAPPCALVVFGASGDLAQLKIIPALYELAREKLLPESFAFIGYGRTEMSDDEFRKHCREAVETNARSRKGKDGIDQSLLNRLLEQSHYHTGQYDGVDDFKALGKQLDQLDQKHGLKGNRLFYMSTPPSAFEPIITTLGKAGLVERAEEPSEQKEGWQRVVIEKPFGTDLKSARHLNAILHHQLAEEQVFRIDHYLGKETVQNLHVLRFANSIFEPIWNHKYIDHVQITVAESVSADDRAGYYDKSGALRDMVQNHIFQLMSLIAMEPPAALDARHIRDEKVKVYQSIRMPDPAKVDTYAVRGQYTAGTYGNDKTTDGYLSAKGVDKNSTTETFAALKLYVDNWRWSGMPFYLRTGKVMPKKLSEIVIRFRSPPLTLFQKQCETAVYPNDLIIQVSPTEGIRWRLNGKVPGSAMAIRQVALDFDYEGTFGKESPEAYERLIVDAINGEQTLFIRGDEAESAWAVIDKVMEGWQKAGKPEPYEPGSWGPKKAAHLIENDGREWVESGEQPEPVIACAL